MFAGLTAYGLGCRPADLCRALVLCCAYFPSGRAHGLTGKGGIMEGYRGIFEAAKAPEREYSAVNVDIPDGPVKQELELKIMKLVIYQISMEILRLT